MKIWLSMKWITNSPLILVETRNHPMNINGPKQTAGRKQSLWFYLTTSSFFFFFFEFEFKFGFEFEFVLILFLTLPLFLLFVCSDVGSGRAEEICFLLLIHLFLRSHPSPSFAQLWIFKESCILTFGLIIEHGNNEVTERFFSFALVLDWRKVNSN